MTWSVTGNHDGCCYVAAVAYRELFKDPYYGGLARDPKVTVLLHSPARAGARNSTAALLSLVRSG
jgi:hypothetical protein